MFEQPGLAIDDLPWIHRDQYVHYVQLARGLSDPDDWPQLREDLLRALTAAFGLDAGLADDDQRSQRRARALELLDQIRGQHNPVTEWPAFFDTLWGRRHAIRPDLA